ncbi:MAG: hypothetical protein JKX69_11230 [Rhodobacteraceae bacterium]|nr:hypothetical protein [Paracoccaceae bacterium]
MQQFGKTLVLLVGLSGCGDPLRNIGRLDDVALAGSEAPATAATAPPSEQADAPGFFQRLFDGTLTEQPVLLPAAAVQSGPLQAAPAGEAAGPNVPAPNGALAGLFQRLISGGAAPLSNPVPEMADAEAVTLPANTAPEDTQPGQEAVAPAPGQTDPDRASLDRASLDPASAPPTVQTVTASAPQQSGFLARLLNGNQATVPDNAPIAEEAALPLSQEHAVAPQETAPDAVLPWGEIGRVCALRRRDRGTQQGAVAGYRLYDTAPELAAPHTMFLTGFADGCARQFTAALALFGDVGTHELVRYETSARTAPITRTDQAYEAIKAPFCRVAEGAPCGARLDALSRNTVFLTLYPAFGGALYADILLHDGEIIAVDFAG